MRSLLLAILCLPTLGFTQLEVDPAKFGVEINEGRPVLTMKIDKAQDDLDPYIDLFLLIDGEPAPVQVSGKYWFEEGVGVQFTPYNRLGDGKWFVARFNFEDGTEEIRFPIAPKEQTESPISEVSEIYPIVNEVPSNVLFFHIRFTQEMTQDQEAYNLVNLVLNDSIIPQAWRHKAFWLDNGKVLVLMIHPARVKRGIHFLSDEDDLFKPGNRISVQVTNQLVDVQGRKIKAGHSEEFLVGERDTIIPKVMYDLFELPTKKSPSLKMVFSEKMNYASIIDGIEIYNDKDRRIDGEFKEYNDETFLFTPYDLYWSPGKYKIVFTKVVADLANNRLNRPFEIEDVNDKLLDVPVEWNFEVK